MPYVSFQQAVHYAKSAQGLISFPTDTVPALASHPSLAEQIFVAKKRDRSKPLILMGATAEDLLPYVLGSDTERETWQQVMASHWPGALTLVLPASDRIPAAMNPNDPTTIGIRVPNRAIACHLLAQTGPLATTSANYSGQPALTTLADIAQQFPDVQIPDPQELETLERSLPQTLNIASNSGIPSTVAKWTGNDWQILRQGSVTL